MKLIESNPFGVQINIIDFNYTYIDLVCICMLTVAFDVSLLLCVQDELTLVSQSSSTVYSRYNIKILSPNIYRKLSLSTYVIYDCLMPPCFNEW